jgi:hypothetical protein
MHQFSSSPLIKQFVRTALLRLDLDIVNVARLRKAEILQSILDDFDTLTRLPFGYLQTGGVANGTLYSIHDAGFFSCLTTILWSILRIIGSGGHCYVIDNALGMHSFKERLWHSTYYDLFAKKERKEIDQLLTVSPLRSQHFDHHSSFEHVIRNHLGIEWASQFLRAYMTPSAEVSTITKAFEKKYEIASRPTISVCIRGTDKHLEVTPTPITTYFDVVDEQMGARQGASVLIQTDQAQIRDKFLKQYGAACKYIEELPVTTGNIVIHRNAELIRDREYFAKQLYAMCLAVSSSEVLITHTGNVGFWLALNAIVRGKPVIQLR